MSSSFFPWKKRGFIFSYSFPTLFCSVSDVIDDRLMPICHSSTLFIFSVNILCLLFWVLQPEKNQIQICNNNITRIRYQWQVKEALHMHIHMCFATPWSDRENYQWLQDKGVCNRKNHKTEEQGPWNYRKKRGSETQQRDTGIGV